MTPYVEIQLSMWGKWAARQAAGALGYPGTSPMFRDIQISNVHTSREPVGVADYVQDTDKAVRRLGQQMRALAVEVYQIGGTQNQVGLRMGISQSRVSVLLRQLHHEVLGHLNDIAAGC